MNTCNLHKCIVLFESHSCPFCCLEDDLDEVQANLGMAEEALSMSKGEYEILEGRYSEQDSDLHAALKECDELNDKISDLEGYVRCLEIEVKNYRD